MLIADKGCTWSRQDKVRQLPQTLPAALCIITPPYTYKHITHLATVKISIYLSKRKQTAPNILSVPIIHFHVKGNPLNIGQDLINSYLETSIYLIFSKILNLLSKQLTFYTNRHRYPVEVFGLSLVSIFNRYKHRDCWNLDIFIVLLWSY